MKELTCIICPEGCHLNIHKEDGEFAIAGSKCKRGDNYAIQEITNPHRSLQTTVKSTLSGHRRASVKTSRDIPLKDVFLFMDAINKTVLSEKKGCGEIIAYGLFGTDVNLILAERLK